MKGLLLVWVMSVGCLLSHASFASEKHERKNDYLSQEEVRSSLIDTLEVFSKVYVYPQKAKEIQKQLTIKLQDGAYDHIKTKQQFLSTIDSELRKLTNDRHLNVMPVKNGEKELTVEIKETKDELKNNFAFQKLEVLPGNIGYMKFNKFYLDEKAKVTVDHAFGFLGHTDAMIFDLRDCVGGSPELVRYMLSHFFEDNTLLWSTHNQDQGKENTWNHFSMSGVGDQRLKSDFPVYILIGPDTSSGGELFSYVLKHFSKAMTVGEKTYGIAHAVSAVEINELFYGRFSVTRPSHPKTGTSWEVVGVIPDIAVSLNESLGVAHKQALDSLALSNIE